MEEILYNILFLYFILINLTSLVLMSIDKARAIKKLWRVPEKVFFIFAILGGSLGTLMGMNIFRHKTKHASFVFGVPAIFIIQIIILLLFWN